MFIEVSNLRIIKEKLKAMKKFSQNNLATLWQYPRMPSIFPFPNSIPFPTYNPIQKFLSTTLHCPVNRNSILPSSPFGLSGDELRIKMSGKRGNLDALFLNTDSELERPLKTPAKKEINLEDIKIKRELPEKIPGRWTEDEHNQFLRGIVLFTLFIALKRYGHNWKKIEFLIPTRNGKQIRSHAQKYFIKQEKKKHKMNQTDHDSIKEDENKTSMKINKLERREVTLPTAHRNLTEMQDKEGQPFISEKFFEIQQRVLEFNSQNNLKEVALSFPLNENLFKKHESFLSDLQSLKPFILQGKQFLLLDLDGIHLSKWKELAEQAYKVLELRKNHPAFKMVGIPEKATY